MISTYATHPGLVRNNNEDYIRTDDDHGMYLLADGIGGHNAGEVASALAVETVYAVLRSNIAHTEIDGYFELMVHAMQTAHWEINSKALTSSSLAKMGTTLVVAVLRKNKAYVVHAGDSRCYLYQNELRLRPGPSRKKDRNKLTRLTRDHTVGNEQLASGIPIDQIAKKKFHTLTQSIGCGNPPYPDSKIVDFKQGDLLLICSDGLTDMVTDLEIEAILADREACLDTLAKNLVDAANLNGGRDNISVVLVKSP
ncbi:MAG TPA: protein phosphatase 2C domain-containing protein [Geobacteraceae bacterium]|nr:protein phosphatase 2C domain-containing protein [Geobacteraceae bacterium]